MIVKTDARALNSLQIIVEDNELYAYNNSHGVYEDIDKVMIKKIFKDLPVCMQFEIIMKTALCHPLRVFDIADFHLMMTMAIISGAVIAAIIV